MLYVNTNMFKLSEANTEEPSTLSIYTENSAEKQLTPITTGKLNNFFVSDFENYQNI